LGKRIEEDYKDFLDVYSGRVRKELKKFIKNGSIVRTRGNGQKLKITIPRIDIPHIVFGDQQEGIGRGPGKKGDVVGKDPEQGAGNQAGQEEQEGVSVEIDMVEVLKFLQDELQLPNLKPKENEVFEEKKIKYNNISKTGPESLRHNRRTMLQALKRTCASGEFDKFYEIPGYKDKVRLIKPINSDRRYRQYREINVPSSNAAIFFARDGSGSMDQYKCDIVSDMAWWIDVWIRSFYKRTERIYIWHDTTAQEVDESKFYKYRYGGGTTCSSAINLIAKQFDTRFPPDKWNIYVFYFTDGENWNDDNEVFCKTIKERFPKNVVNLFGLTQVLPYSSANSLKEYVDSYLNRPGISVDNVKTTGIGFNEAKGRPHLGSGFFNTPELGEEERNSQIKQSIIDLLGTAVSKPAKANQQ
jgi:hypothetical protein